MPASPSAALSFRAICSPSRDGRFPSCSCASDALLVVEHLAHLPRESVWGDGLLEKVEPGLEHSVPDDGVVRIARYVEDLQGGMESPQMLDEHRPAHPRHHDVAHSQMDGLG